MLGNLEGSRASLYLKMMLLWAERSFPPYWVSAQDARGRTPNRAWHSSEKAWKSQAWGSNMSWTPSVHRGITISVHAWGSDSGGWRWAMVQTGEAMT